MVDLACAILGHGGKVFRRNILHVFGDDLPNGTARKAGCGLWLGEPHNPCFQGKPLRRGLRLERGGLFVGQLESDGHHAPLFKVNPWALLCATPVPESSQRRERPLRRAGVDGFGGSLDAVAEVSGDAGDNQRRGGVAIKFEIAYFRSLHFDDPPKATVAAVYAKYRAGGVPTEAEYKDFQDYLFRYLLREAGRLHLPVHLHTAVGTGDFYNVTTGTALNLENILRDPRYDATTFVLLHGGYPFQEQAIWLAARKNVYLDTSLMELYLYPEDFKQVLRHWFLLFPEKALFGSDAFPFSDSVGAEESYWIAVRTARVSLAAALADMIGNHEITEERALAFAHGYLHDNAAALYPH